MSNAFIVQFDISTPGEHCLLTKKDFDGLNAEVQTTYFQALIRIVGEGCIVGLLLKTHRKENSTKDLALKTQISESMINRIENGSKKITPEILDKLKTALPNLEQDLIAIGIKIRN